jgi:hypothetical protein
MLAAFMAPGWVASNHTVHDPRCISLTSSEFNCHCDCATLRLLDEGDDVHS